MAVDLECINLIIPVRRVAAVWRGGFTAFWREHGGNGRLWHDGRLLRDGAMNPYDMLSLLDFWEQRGLVHLRGGERGREAVDLCVVDTLGGQLSGRCAWLDVDWENSRARLRDTGKRESSQPRLL